MPLSPSAIKELRAELSYIESMQEKYAARASVIKAVLEPFDVGRVAGTPTTVEQQVVSPVPKAVGSKFASTGLRAAILNVLRLGPGRAPNIATILAQQGFKNDSTTPLATRVYNDLWRMKEAGIVENKDGVFSLKEVA